jgi:shikimate dehydrogenase
MHRLRLESCLASADKIPTMTSGKTTLIAHLGYPTEAFKAPMIYNPWFERRGIDAVVVPMGVKSEDYPATLDELRVVAQLRY